MKVCLLSDAILPPLTGIGRYAWELAQGIERNPEIESRRYLGYRGKQTFDELQRVASACDTSQQQSGLTSPARKAAISARVRAWLINWRIVSAVYQAKQSFEYHRHLADANHWVVHGPNYHIPEKVPSRTRRIVTVHDLSTFIGPQWHPSERVRRMDTVLPLALAAADRIITDAVSTAELLVSDFAVARERIESIPLGVDSIFFAPEPLPREPFTLCVSTIEPRKNIGTLLRCYRSLPDDLRRAFPLVLVGEYGWRSHDEHASIREGVAEGWLEYQGFVSETALVDLYQRARLCVYPSLHEGFGLPLLEAFAAGAPVLAGNHTSIPEVAGGHARLLDDVTDIDEMREAIRAELSAPWDRVAASERVTQARKYSWAATVEKTIACYRSLV